jgi:hypothetical protein
MNEIKKESSNKKELETKNNFNKKTSTKSAIEIK